MTGIILSLLYMAVFAFAGLCLAARALPREKTAAKLMLGLTFGLAMMMWLPALIAFLTGAFTLWEQIGALVLALFVAAMACFRRTAGEGISESTPKRLGVYCFQLPFALKPGFLRSFIKREKAMLLVTTPFFILCLYLLYTHTLLPRNGALYTGQSTFGDMNMHLGFITSIAEQGFFPPEYSIMAGTPLYYPFLNASVSSTLLLVGAPLRAAYILPALWALGCVLTGLYLFFEAWFKRTNTAVLAVLLFLLGGGFGFWYFLDGSGADSYNFSRIFTAFYETPTNYVVENIRWVNPIADMLIPQRATLFGWALLFPALYLLRRAVDGENAFVPLGLLAGALPLVHTHSFLALGLVSIPVFLYECNKGPKRALRFWPYIALAAALALPQLFAFTFRQSSAEGFLRSHFNWANEGDPYFWFYIKNLGLLALLLPPAAVFAGKEHRRFASGALLILFICECFVFQPNEYDNNKLLFIAFAFACGLAAHFLTGVNEKLKGVAGRKALAVITLAVLFLSGTLTVAREAVSHLDLSGNDYYGNGESGGGEAPLAFELYSAHNVSAANWVSENAPSDAVFLTAPNHNNAIASLTGRNIVCGSDSFLYFHGVDAIERHENVRRMYEEYGALGALKDAYKIDYAYLSNHEWYEYVIEYGAFSGYPVVFESGDVAIYAVSERAKANLF